jgi:phenylacetate-CoA ligase
MNRNINRKLHDIITNLQGKKYREILDVFEQSQWLGKEEIADYQLKKFLNILNYAYNNVDYYHDLLEKNGIHPSDIKSYNDIKSLPKLTKKILVSTSLKRLISHRKVHFSIRKTSGTSGIPLKIYADRESDAFCLAARYRSQNWHGINIGDRQIRFWGRSISGVSYWKELCKDVALNRIKVSRILCNEKKVISTVNRIVRFKPDYFYGYSSLLLQFAKQINKKAKNNFTNLKAIIPTAEKLSSQQRIFLKNVFGCNIAEEYGCSEVDIIAFECEYGSMHIISENLLVEVVNESNNDTVGKVIVSDLNNRKMPLIRYELDDFVKLSNKRCKCGRNSTIISKIEGRSQKRYIVFKNGEKIHCVTLAYLIEELIDRGIGILQFKIIQLDFNVLKVLLVLAPKFQISDEKLAEIIKNEFNLYLEYKMKIIVQNVELIESNNSGKFEYFESKLNNTDKN